MEKEIAIEKAMSIILNSMRDDSLGASILGKNNDFNKGKLPVSPFDLNVISKTNMVVMSEEAFNELKSIREYTLEANREIAFYVFGEERENGVLWLDTVISNYDINHIGSANFESIKPFLMRFVDEYKKGEYSDTKQVVCYGHTHSMSSETHDNFSLDDLASYITFVNSDEVFRNGMKTVGCLLNPSGDYNFYAYNYDIDKEQVCIYSEVFVAYNNGVRKQLPAYQKGQYQNDESFKSRLI